MLIASIIVLSIIGIFILGHSLNGYLRKSKSKTWKVGDILILDSQYVGPALLNQLKKTGTTPTLSGWNKNNVFIIADGRVYQESWLSIKTNKSNNWRNNFNSCKEYMGKNPSFDQDVSTT
jgi:hypothetical protein